MVAWLMAAGLLIAQAPATVTTADAPLTHEAYVQELTRLHTAVQALDERTPATAAAVLATVPRTWHVATGDLNVEVDAAWLREGLALWQRQPDAATRATLSSFLQGYLDDARSATSATTTPPASRVALDRILSAREFAAVRGPSAWEVFRNRLMAWFINLLGRVVGASAVPTVARWLIRVLVVVTVGVVAVWMYRALRRAGPLGPPRLAAPATPDLRSWYTLLAAARAAADRADWRDAVHLAYWTAIAFLESNGAWRPDASRTPREYVGLLRPSDRARAPLASLTQVFEQVWYAAASADAGRFKTALAALEELGCLPR